MGNTMTKSELLLDLYEQFPEYRERDCAEAVRTIIDRMGEALASGNRIEVRGFGTFGVKYREGRVGRNPRTGQTMEIKPRCCIYFKPGKSLRERVDYPQQKSDES